MSTRKPRPPAGPSGYAPTGPRELIVVAHPAAELRASGTAVASAAGAEVSGIAGILAGAGATMHPLFGPSEERVRSATAGTMAAAAAATGVEAPELATFYRVDAPDAAMDQLARELRAHDAVETAYVKPPAEPAVLNDMAPAAGDAPPVTPTFTARQGYLEAAPGGVDARYAWTRAGGGGAGVRIIDVEGAWRFSHEDLVQAQGGVVGGTQIADIGWRNHGTAVLGEFSGDRNAFGVTGICPDAVVSAVSFSPNGSAAAIRAAADRLGPGDVLLIELHRPGPRFNFQGRNDQLGYIAVEWWPDDFAAIQYAVGRGVTVVEAAGNGAENLADAIYDVNPGNTFPSTWRNPFRRSPADSGAVLVGAGAPPPGTHGRDHGPDRSRLDFSNFGPNVDTQGWGREVTTCGYGDLQGGANEDIWYTDQFSGTSSASPIVVGVVGALQGALRAAGRPVLTPAQVRAALRSTGSPQQDAAGRPATQRIGNRPNLRQLIDQLIPAPSQTVPLYRYWNGAAGDHFYTTSWSELGTGRNGWAYEGVQCYVHATARPGTAALYRYWNAGAADHFYTTSWAELGSGRYGWAYEGIQCYVPVQQQAGTVPLYRYWNAGIGDHFYTTSWAELGGGRYGWTYEGVQCYVSPQPVPASPSAGAPAAAVEPAEEVRAGEAVAGGRAVPPSFAMGAAPAEAGVAEPEPVGPAAGDGGQAGNGFDGSFSVPEWFRVAGSNGENGAPGGRPRQVTVTFSDGR